MLNNLFSVSDPTCAIDLWMCQTLIRAHVAGFSRLLTFVCEYVCVCVFFNVSHLTISVFIMCHLVGGPSAARTAAERLDVAGRIASHSVSFDESRSSRSSKLSQQR